MTPRFFFFDVETTGATAVDKVCELAFIEVDENLNEIQRAHSLIDPERPISPSASGVNGITDDMVFDSPTIEEYFGLVLPPIEGQIVFIAHKAMFDRRYLEPHLPPIVGQICTLRLARRALKKAENHKLSTLMYQYGLEKGISHRADGDVLTTVSLVRFILTLPAFAGQSLFDLAAADDQKLVIDEMPFGKWKGTPMSDLDKSYARWALKNLTDLDPDLHHTLTLRAEGKL